MFMFYVCVTKFYELNWIETKNNHETTTQPNDQETMIEG